MPRTVAALLVLLSSTVISAATLRIPGQDGSVTTIDLEPSRCVIIEFEGKQRETLERFRRDLPTIDRRVGKTAVSAIRHEYAVALLGVAIDAPPEVLSELRRLPYVRAIHRDVRVEKQDAVAVDAAVRVNAVNLPTRGVGITVGVIDTGIDYHHPAFGAAFGPGHKVAGGWDFVNQDADPDDDEGHGTHVAGIIAADSPELRGVAPYATLYAWKALNQFGQGWVSDVIAAMERSVDPNGDGDPADHLDVINLSFGGPGEADDIASRAADSAMAAGVVVVVAAGNEERVGSILSPGTSRKAITVGAVDSADNVPWFSSRGPSPKHLGFKPDLVAPGVGIVSARMGGGLIASSGTSMAAPHVAGVAALLRALHPDWTPADVKSALIMGAAAVGATPLAGGAGRVDAAGAAAATLFVGDSGLSFGLNASAAGTWEATRTLQVTNRATTEATFQITTTMPSGITLAAVPTSVTLAPGETRTIEVRLTADSAALPFSDQLVVGGAVVFQGPSSLFDVPWALVRSARTTLTTDSESSIFLASGGNPWIRPVRYSATAAEMFLKSGSRTDYLLVGDTHFVLRERHVAEGDQVVPLLEEAATARITLDSRDAAGVPLAELSKTSGRHALNVMFGSPTLFRGLLVLDCGSAKELRFSPASELYHLYVFESYFDLDHARVYNVQHDRLVGLTGPVTLSRGPSSYRHARIRWQPKPSDAPRQLLTCTYAGIRDAQGTRFEQFNACDATWVSSPLTLDYYTAPEAPGAFSGLRVNADGIDTPLLRGIDQEIVAAESGDRPPQARYRMADGDEVTIGDSALYPFALPGSVTRSPTDPFPHGLLGPLGERYWDVDLAWTMYGSDATVMASGTYRTAEPPRPVPNGRFVAVSDALPGPTGRSRGELEVQFGDLGGDGKDVNAPTLTSMRILDAHGRATSHVTAGTAASLAFSAIDLEWGWFTEGLRSERTRVWYRVSGSPDWIERTAAIQGYEYFINSRHDTPSGDLYRVDLSPATARAGVTVDVRIQVEDLSGNRTTWTYSPAVFVDSAKRRSVR